MSSAALPLRRRFGNKFNLYACSKTVEQFSSKGTLHNRPGERRDEVLLQ